MSNKRKRDKTLTIRLTEKEKAYIERQAKKANLNLTNYIVKLSLETSIIVKEDTRLEELYQPILYAVKKEQRDVEFQMLKDAIAFQSEIYHLIRKIVH